MLLNFFVPDLCLHRCLQHIAISLSLSHENLFIIGWLFSLYQRLSSSSSSLFLPPPSSFSLFSLNTPHSRWSRCSIPSGFGERFSSSAYRLQREAGTHATCPPHPTRPCMRREKKEREIGREEREREKEKKEKKERERETKGMRPTVPLPSRSMTTFPMSFILNGDSHTHKTVM